MVTPASFRSPTCAQLRKDICPRACENFLLLCTGRLVGAAHGGTRTAHPNGRPSPTTSRDADVVPRAPALATGERVDKLNPKRLCFKGRSGPGHWPLCGCRGRARRRPRTRNNRLPPPILRSRRSKIHRIVPNAILQGGDITARRRRGARGGAVLVGACGSGVGRERVGSRVCYGLAPLFSALLSAMSQFHIEKRLPRADPPRLSAPTDPGARAQPRHIQIPRDARAGPRASHPQIGDEREREREREREVGLSQPRFFRLAEGRRDGRRVDLRR